MTRVYIYGLLLTLVLVVTAILYVNQQRAARWAAQDKALADTVTARLAARHARAARVVEAHKAQDRVDQRTRPLLDSAKAIRARVKVEGTNRVTINGDTALVPPEVVSALLSNDLALLAYQSREVARDTVILRLDTLVAVDSATIHAQADRISLLQRRPGLSLTFKVAVVAGAVWAVRHVLLRGH